MSITRRDLLKAGAVAATVAAMPRSMQAQFGRRPEPVPPIEDPRLKALALRALDAAKSAGAAYADVRLTHERVRNFSTTSTKDSEILLVGVRALVEGYWGFASSPVWSPDEMARLAREAVHQAKTNALGQSRPVELAAAPVVADGHWTMPVAIDPLAVSPFEVRDFLSSLSIYTGRFPETRPAGGLIGTAATAVVQEKAFASTAGSYCTQRCYRTGGELTVSLAQSQGRHTLDCLTPAGMGWELFVADKLPRIREGTLREEIRRAIEDMKEDLRLPFKPVEVGRYDTVFNALGMAYLVQGTLGPATELDRTLGYEANAGGTSYLNDPFNMVGSYQAGAPALTLTAERSEPGAVATVKWDDEGVEPDAFPIVKDGMLVDFQTTRESASWLKDYYAKANKPVRSHGCAAAPSAVYAPMQRTPNLTLAPGREPHDFDALVKGLTTGIAIEGTIKTTRVEMDFQHASGLWLGGRVYEVKNGKRVARIATAGFLFRATELWKSLQALGGEASLRRYGRAAQKGEPAQECWHSVTAAPAVVKDLTVIDPLRKA
jgi:TldD protein